MYVARCITAEIFIMEQGLWGEDTPANAANTTTQAADSAAEDEQETADADTDSGIWQAISKYYHGLLADKENGEDYYMWIFLAGMHAVC